uniref:Uncharacterized protein n=1 Tax=Aureoumbra lagunensis TaxID=44058 RepID=A0A7S3K342_9STRA|mmetsp:Transcript_24959/g.31332  ORF Transcript_24959/g.31332 Transcript_24959/m.31332 type:complete len:208 (+) Transcript_24959:480-1103(+)
MKPNESPFKADASPASLTKKALNDPSLLVYAIILFPINAAARQVLSIALRSRFTEVVPRKNTASALAALDVALSAVGVVSPIVGGFLLDASGGDHQAIDSYTLARQPLIVASLNAISALLFAGLAFFASSFSQEKKEFLSSHTSSDSSGGPGPSVVSFSFLPSTSSPSDRKTTVATNKYHKDVDHDNEGVGDGYALCAHDDRKVKHL